MANSKQRTPAELKNDFRRAKRELAKLEKQAKILDDELHLAQYPQSNRMTPLQKEMKDLYEAKLKAEQDLEKHFSGDRPTGFLNAITGVSGRWSRAQNKPAKIEKDIHDLNKDIQERYKKNGGGWVREREKVQEKIQDELNKIAQIEAELPRAMKQQQEELAQKKEQAQIRRQEAAEKKNAEVIEMKELREARERDRKKVA